MDLHLCLSAISVRYTEHTHFIRSVPFKTTKFFTYDSRLVPSAATHYDTRHFGCMEWHWGCLAVPLETDQGHGIAWQSSRCGDISPEHHDIPHHVLFHSPIPDV
ncbi:hypothetical protein PAXRUDRAFT_365798 [Paxillus rubicundulus Ve08.2h10]|uniref:Uncharacterized protein n=1 Tax=Paxillus rubicundulus Ve08.2h10 TaxID=930991 RepID=A0A0D0DRK0_9AGAM|nr:hypothetical protein PAXRUDRAFT_365798 [Paxillus rubicundulus Ve08.2h10]